VIAQIVLAVFAFMYTGDLATAARNGFGKLWDARTDDKTREAIYAIQRALQCCGNNNAAEWGLPIPDSCCASGSTCLIPFTTGCGEKLGSFVDGSGTLIAWIAMVFAAVEVSCLEDKQANHKDN